jgi:RsiW-degrading membrane proteinase PrsW (M82 family)
VPAIEELIKPLAVWFFARGLNSPANGFTLGALSGAAFALMESLNVSGDGSISWFAIVIIRAGTSLLHITSSGLMGFAIVELFKRKNWGRFLVTYLAMGFLHGIWNACAAATAMAVIGGSIGRPEWLAYLPAAVLGISTLIVGMFAILITANRRIRSASLPPHEEARLGEEQGTIPA